MLLTSSFRNAHKFILFVALLVFVAPSLLLLHNAYSYTVCTESGQSSKSSKDETVVTKEAKNTISKAVKKTQKIKNKVTTGTRTQEKDLCANYRELYSQCDRTILHDLSTLTLLPQNKEKFLQSLTLSKEKPNTSKRVECPRTPLKRFNSSLTTGLVSHAGSGNTWTRYLIQQLTGYMTGALYYSGILKRNGFPGEGLRDHVIVVKSHTPDEKESPIKLDRRIVVVRNPYDSMLAEFKRDQLGLGHTKGAHALGIDEKKEWEKEFKRAIGKWAPFMKTVFQNSSKPTLVLFYEDMVACLPSELIKLAQFLKTDFLTNFSFCCVLKYNEGMNHRNHTEDQLSADTMYSENQQLLMDQTLELVGSKIESTYPKVAQRFYNYRRQKK